MSNPTKIRFFFICPVIKYPIRAQQHPISSTKNTQRNKSEESKMFETITVGLIHKIYIIYIAFNIKKKPKTSIMIEIY